MNIANGNLKTRSVDRRLVDAAAGRIDRSIFSDQDIFDQEMEQVFEASWLFVGHESQLPNNGDYFTSQVGREPVIVARDSSGEIKVMLNVCTHRGMPVCRYDKGNAKAFACPYHGWTFANNGTLKGVPLSSEGYGGNLDRKEFSLINARVATFYGTIWATFDQSLPSLEDSLGDMGPMLREFLRGPDGADDGLEAIDGVLKFEIHSNWKFGAENYAGDLYHACSHNSVQRVGLSLTGLSGRHVWDADKSTFRQLNVAYPDGGHAARVSLYDEADREYFSQWKLDPDIDEYFREAHYARNKLLGEEARLLNRGGIVFPNMAYNAAARTSISMWIPRSPGVTEVWRWVLIPRHAPQAVRDAIRRYLLRYGGPAGMVEQDDFENWAAAQVGAESKVARQLPFNYELRLDEAKWAWPEPWLGERALVDEGVSEHAQRVFYARWAQMMTGEPSPISQQEVLA